MSAVALAVCRKCLRLRLDKLKLVGNCIGDPFLIVCNLRTLRRDMPLALTVAMSGNAASPAVGNLASGVKFSVEFTRPVQRTLNGARAKFGIGR